MSVLGPLVSMDLEHGDLRPLLEAAATRTYETPQGRRVRPRWRTLEAWYYAHKHGGLEALEPATRKDTGTCRALPEALAQHILALRREQPRRSVRTLVRAIERAGMCRVGETSASSVLRLLRAHGLSQRPSASPARERRPFLPEHPGDLWMGDSMHGPRVRIWPIGQVLGDPQVREFLGARLRGAALPLGGGPRRARASERTEVACLALRHALPWSADRLI